MKTAMQELIEAIELITKKFKRELSTEEILDMCNNQLDKEKEQICNAYTDGLEGPYIGSEYYYNKTYNQKQHIIDIMKADEDDGLYNQKNNI